MIANDKETIEIIKSLPRELFVPNEFKDHAYYDMALPIDCKQTTSQPSLIAYMIEKLDIKSTDKVLEIGTGSGFQTAALSKIAKEVYTIEIHKELSEKAKLLLKSLNLNNINYKISDGKIG
jgi:protein-L-isoaspartate(D-aspartate) O-methyltransferase